ncbi:hypothetical protein D8B26_008186 [Coccidioides posadasii str. Silveira]|uniref:Uncharacterized protein n=2 Tax=Coccidioides posadasii TaxID=199306 RepID=E9DGF9_COCPS|nr:conserved hypothetical protein [Coccidioides posadasii str. Silveira]KMM69574.1 hypothetical protein CPAG_05889 [Coccidioides posadasii RMSCC 3488]QVM13578.1 hypothetical protein D8B26_008186 [Coccidioides posadasii str. Silveira]
MAAPPDRATRHNRMMSFTSNKSEKSSKTHKSRDSKPKVTLIESHREKEANRIHTHADPTRAISEAQPSAIALEKSNLESLRGIQHKDRFGNVITDPDLSNPTRHRFERPLDTIRAFEAAIDGTYNSRRLSYARDDSVNGQSRPTSYFGDPRGNLTLPTRGYSDQNNHYNTRGFQSRRDSYVDAYGDSGHNQYNSYHDAQPRRPRHAGRPHNDQWGPPQNGYVQQQGQYQSYDSGSASGSGNHSMDHLAQSTDPSSLSSSRDGLQQQPYQQQPSQPPQLQHLQQQLQQQQQQKKIEAQIGEAYGFTGFGTDPQLNNSQPPFQSLSNGSSSANHTNGVTQRDGYASEALAPAPPPKQTTQVTVEPARKDSFMQKAKISTEKRKSWFKRLSKG